MVCRLVISLVLLVMYWLILFIKKFRWNFLWLFFFVCFLIQVFILFVKFLIEMWYLLWYLFRMFVVDCGLLLVIMAQVLVIFGFFRRVCFWFFCQGWLAMVLYLVLNCLYKLWLFRLCLNWVMCFCLLQQLYILLKILMNMVRSVLICVLLMILVF